MPSIPDDCRARYRTAEQIRQEGAIGNLFDGVEITTLSPGDESDR